VVVVLPLLATLLLVLLALMHLANRGHFQPGLRPLALDSWLLEALATLPLGSQAEVMGLLSLLNCDAIPPAILAQ
jgi:hypothetical protein